MNKFINSKIANIFFTILIAFFIVLIVICASINVDESKLKINNSKSFNDNWYVIDNGEKQYFEVVNRTVTDTIDKTLTIYNVLPTDVIYDSISFVTKNEKVYIYLDNELIYNYADDLKLPFYNEIGSVHNLVNLGSNYQGKTIKIELIPIENTLSINGLSDYSFLIGTQNDIIMSIVMDNLVTIIVCAILFFIGLYFIILGITYLILKNKRGLVNLYYGIFILIATAWTMADSLLFQFIFKSVFVNYIIFNMTFMLIPIPLTLFFGEIFVSKKPFYNIMCIVCAVYFFLRMFLYMIGVLNFEFGLMLMHLLMGIVLVYTVYLSIYDRKDMISKYTLIGIILFLIIDFFSLLLFWLTKSLVMNRYGYSTGFFVGIFIFVIVYGIGALKDNQRVQNDAIKLNFLQNCAYSDPLTDLGNRASFEKALDKIDERKDQINSISVLMLDLNNLKETNDSFGHNAGDLLIIKMCACLQKTFKSVASVYRIGGDEMTILIENISEEQVNDYINKLSENVMKYNINAKVKISYAIGYAYSDDFGNMNVRNLFRLADFRMYKNKEIMKSNLKK